MRLPLALVVLLLFSLGSASAQDFNVDIGEQFGEPPSSFGGAGQSGYWNRVHTNTVLYDIDGRSTEVSIDFREHGANGYQPGGPAMGEAKALLEDGGWLGDVVESVELSGLLDGEYELILYGIVTSDPAGRTSFWVGNEQGTAGGEWTGTFEPGLTHVTFTVQVDGGKLTISMVGGLAWSGFFSGFQLKHLGAVGVETSNWGRIKALYRP